MTDDQRGSAASREFARGGFLDLGQGQAAKTGFMHLLGIAVNWCSESL